MEGSIISSHYLNGSQGAQVLLFLLFSRKFFPGSRFSKLFVKWLSFFLAKIHFLETPCSKVTNVMFFWIFFCIEGDANDDSKLTSMLQNKKKRRGPEFFPSTQPHVLCVTKPLAQASPLAMCDNYCHSGELIHCGCVSS